MKLNSLFGRCTLITGDINAKGKLWESPCTDERGLMIEDLINILSILAACTTDVKQWYMQNGLQLNPDKSEALFMGTAT